MVALVRRGASVRAVARRVGVSPERVRYWVLRAGTARLDRVDWSDRRARGHAAVNRSAPGIAARVLALRDTLARTSVLGEYGAVAIHQHWPRAAGAPPSVRTIGRILVRRGAVRAHGRVRHPPPPAGWYLPPVAAGRAEVDLLDFIEDLKLRDGPLVHVLTAVSLHGGLPGAWPVRVATTDTVLRCLHAHWRRAGMPAFAQFDNDTRFQGPHQHRDAVGRVVRTCLQLGVTPVFVPPRELGMQNRIEHFNGLFQAKVWHRVHFTSLPSFQAYTQRYLVALCARRAARIADAPPRVPLGRAPASTQIIYLRRCTEHGTIRVLGRTWPIDPAWAYRLVRAEVDLAQRHLRCYGLRRRDPTVHPLLCTHPCTLPP